MHSFVMRRRIASLLVAAAALAQPAALFAHDVPTDVLVQAFVKPEGQRLNLLVRVPLRAILDVEIPKRGPGYLDLGAADVALREGANGWITSSVEMYENGTRLEERIAAIRVSLPSDPSFRSYDEALAHIRGAPLAPETELYWEQGMLDVWYEYPIQSAESHFAIRPTFWRLGLRVQMALRFLPGADAPARTYEVGGDPGLISLDPSRTETGRRFGVSGFLYALKDVGQLLFLLCLIIPVRRLATLTPVAVSFVVGYSLTLVASAFDLAPTGPWFPPLISTLLAATVIYLACENIVGWRLDRRVTAFSFGLLYGFGFSLALGDSLQFAGGHLLTAVLSFNAGIALGHAAVLAVLGAGLALLFQVGIVERIGGALLSALAIHPSWHQTGERGLALIQFSWLDVTLLAGLVRWTTAMVALVGLGWLLVALLESWPERHRLENPVADADK
jgi:hypothetical protein